MAGSAASPIRSGIPLLRGTSSEGVRAAEGPKARGGFLSATLATFARSLPVPLAYRTPLRGDSHS
ncbi:MAG: hypothetical protein WBB46_08150, partial [Candidatus Deferrimicrobiaceae bacterium]